MLEHVIQKAELHVIPLRALCVGAELSEGTSRALSRASTPWCSFLCSAALFTVLPCQVNILPGGEVCSSCWRREDFHISAFIVQGQSGLRFHSWFPWVQQGYHPYKRAFQNSIFSSRILSSMLLFFRASRRVSCQVSLARDQFELLLHCLYLFLSP